MSKNRQNRYMPLIMAVCVVVGIIIGTFYANHFSGNRLSIINSSSNKRNNLLHIIDDQYVDTVNVNQLVEKAMPQILAELDPHSVYISAQDVQAANDDLKGSFSGVGIEFTIREDTIRVQNVIGNGPAERAGLIAGDKIVSVDGKPFVGKEVTNQEAMRRLKGPKDTKVKLGIVRYGEKKVKYFTVTRGEIPQKSITATYMLDDETGYIKVKNFGENTYPELLIALAELSQEGVENLVIDLRGNLGGYLNSAYQLANEFLPKGRLVVYTQGRKSPRQEYRSDGRGSYQKIPLVVLIDESSASASEIFAGAMQDNDRATIIGRRSFGKGLVQQQFNLSENSAVRLTVARYYTPSGRCIQKPYKDESKYTDEIMSRYLNGEMDDPTKYHHDKNEKTYKTIKGRTVYGGGGITPDKFIGIKLKGTNSYYQQLYDVALYDFSFFYTDHNRSVLAKIKDRKAMEDYLNSQHIEVLLAQYAQRKNKIRINPYMLAQSKDLIRNKLNACIIRNFFGDNGFFATLNEDDPTVAAAMGK